MRMNKSHTSSTVCTMSPGIMSLLTLCHDTAHKHRGGKARIWILLSNFFSVSQTSVLLLWVVSPFIRLQSCFLYSNGGKIKMISVVIRSSYKTHCRFAFYYRKLELKAQINKWLITRAFLPSQKASPWGSSLKMNSSSVFKCFTDHQLHGRRAMGRDF